MDDQGDYTFTLQRSITGARSIQLISYNIMWSFPNVQTSTNTISFVENGGSTLTATIDVGNYNIGTLAQALVTAMNMLELKHIPYQLIILQ